jgi:hypothetical protein
LRLVSYGSMSSESNDWVGFFPQRSPLEAAALAYREHFSAVPDVEALRNWSEDFVIRAVMAAVWRGEQFDAKATARAWGRGRPSMRPRAGKGSPAVAATRAKADAYAASLAPIIQEIRAGGITTLSGIARALTHRRVPLPRGGFWSSTTVARLLDRLGIAPSRRRRKC